MSSLLQVMPNGSSGAWQIVIAAPPPTEIFFIVRSTPDQKAMYLRSGEKTGLLTPTVLSVPAIGLASFSDIKRR